MITQPQAGIKIYNYTNRLGSKFDNNKINDETIEGVLKIKNEIISISTVKHKAQPSGEFQITLALETGYLLYLQEVGYLSI